MKTIGSKVSIGTAFILGASAGWFAKAGDVNFLFTHYVPALVTLLAAYFGAKHAFDFQSNREKHEQRKKSIVSGNLAIFKLSDMLDTLLSYRNEIIEPARNKPISFLEMNATIPQVREHISIDFDSLAFLLGTDDKNVLGEVARDVARYNEAFVSINERSRVHRYEVQPALASAGFVSGGSYSVEDIIGVLGEPLYQTLCNATNQVTDNVDSTIDSMGATATKLTTSLREQFPDEYKDIISILLPTE
jgi:hypothetical protein